MLCWGRGRRGDGLQPELVSGGGFPRRLPEAANLHRPSRRGTRFRRSPTRWVR